MAHKITREEKNILNNIRGYQKILQINHNCPNGVHYIIIRGDLLKVEGLNKSDSIIHELIAEYDLIQKKSTLQSQELVENFYKAKAFIDNKELEAELANKKLLVVLGESHYSQQSFLLEAAILTYLKTKFFSSLLVEHTESYLKSLLLEFNSQQLLRIPDGIAFAYKMLDYKLHSIDPLKHVNSINKYNHIRNTAQNLEIASHSSEDQVCIVGASHLDHIAKSPDIQEKFVIAPIDLRINYSQHAPKLEESLGFKIRNASDESLKLDFSNSIESFSFLEISNIYKDWLHVFLGEEPVEQDTTYESYFPEHTEICKNFAKRVVPEIEYYKNYLTHHDEF